MNTNTKSEIFEKEEIISLLVAARIIRNMPGLHDSYLISAIAKIEGILKV